jgi:hypothetical protein
MAARRRACRPVSPCAVIGGGRHAAAHTAVGSRSPGLAAPGRGPGGRRQPASTAAPVPPSASKALEADLARWAEEIPASEALAGQLAAELSDAEAKLEGLLDGIKGEVEAHHQALAKARRGAGAGAGAGAGPRARD